MEMELEAPAGVSSWTRAKRIGEGSFGTVDLAVVRSQGGGVFAVKSVERRVGQECRVEALENEVGVLRRLSSPYVVGYLGDDVSVEGQAAASFRNLHLEYMPGGTVADLALRSGGECAADVDEMLLRSYTYCIASALSYVHSVGLVHCDVKGRNVLVGGTAGVAKLADFGAARRSAGEFGGRGGAISPRGSPLWMAPEVIRREYQGPESDVWSLGCTVIEMISGKPAWEDCGADTLVRIGFSGDLPELPAQLSDLGRDFLDKCLRREPAQRWSCDQLLKHPFISSSSPNSNSITDASPRSVLDCFNFSDDEDEEPEPNPNPPPENSVAAHERIRKLAAGVRVNWESEDWVEVRRGIGDRGEAKAGSCSSGDEGEGEGANSEYSNSSSKKVTEYPTTRVKFPLANFGKQPGCGHGSKRRYHESWTNGSGENKGTEVYSYCKLRLSLLLFLLYSRSIMRTHSPIFYFCIIYSFYLSSTSDFLIYACAYSTYGYQKKKKRDPPFDISQGYNCTIINPTQKIKLLSTCSKIIILYWL